MASTSQAPETENKPPLYCVGCSKDITNVPADRRSLQSAASDHVVQTWKALLERVLRQREVDIHIDVDSLVSNGRMCRKCFSAYDRYKTLQASLLSNLKEAIDVAAPTTSSSSPKRARLDSSASRHTTASVLQLQRPAGSTSASPDVEVSHHFQLAMVNAGTDLYNCMLFLHA